MEWAHFQHEIGYCFDYPVGWQVKVSELAATCTVTSPDGLWFALIQPMPYSQGPISPSDAIKFMIFLGKDSFPQAQVEDIKTDSNSAEARISYRAPDGSQGRAMWVYLQGSDAGTVYSCAAPAAAFDAATPTLARIIRSQNEAILARNKSVATPPIAHPTPPAPISPAPISSPPASVPSTSAAPTSTAPAPIAPTPANLEPHGRDIEWAHYQDEIGYCFDYPAGWQVKVNELTFICTVTSPDGLWIVMLQPLPYLPGQITPSDVIKHMAFPGRDSFPQAQIGEIDAKSDLAIAPISFRAPDGSERLALLTYWQCLDAGMVFSCAAPAAAFDTAMQTMFRIVSSQTDAIRARKKSVATPPIAHPAPPAPISPAPISPPPASVRPTSAAATSTASAAVAPTPGKPTPMAPTPMAEISAALQRSFHSIQDYIRSKQQPQRPPTGPPPVPQTPMAQISAALQRSFHSFEEYIRSKQQQQHPPAAPTPHLANLPPLPTKAPTPVASTPVALIPVAPIPMAPTALPPLPGPPTPVTPLRSNIPSQAFVATEQPPQRPPAAPTPLPAPIAPLAPLAPFVRYPTRPSASPAQIQYAQFTDPQRGSFTVDVPVGWRVSGGLQIASVGDVRPWLELNSPDGIYLLSDPDFPLSLCHMWLGFNGVMVSVGAGGQFMCLKPSAEKSADCYLSKLGARRLPQFVRVSRRPRPEIAEWVRTAAMAAGVKAGRKSKFQAIETTLERKTGANLVASLLSTCAFNGSYCPIGFAFWQSWNIVCISPAHLASSADAVRTHVLKSLAYTPAMQQVAQQITAQTNANAQAIHAAQVANFNNLQAQHRAQTAMGDAIISNYRNQEATNDSIMSGWEHNEAVYDQLSQQRSDAMMDHQRLSDDAAGKTYEVPAGSNYYWHDERTGDVVGTPTDQPPDYQNNYTQLRKL